MVKVHKKGEKMKITQDMIATRAGVDRSTVSKILSNNPNYHPNEHTREKVFRIAEELGYDFGAIHNPLRRKYSRFDVNVAVSFKIVFESGEIFDTGTGVLRNISTGGALLTDIKTTKETLPIKFFTIEVAVNEIEGLQDIVAECEVVRFGVEGTSILAQIGLKFRNLLPTARQRVNNFLETRKTQRIEERIQKMGKAPEGSVLDRR